MYAFAVFAKPYAMSCSSTLSCTCSTVGISAPSTASETFRVKTAIISGVMASSPTAWFALRMAL